MKSNKRIKAGKQQGNPGYRTAAVFRGALKFKQAYGQTKKSPK